MIDSHVYTQRIDMKSYGTMGALRSIDYNKYFVIGLVHNEGGHITDGLYPNHYVQLLGFNRQNYASFWTWGEKKLSNLMFSD